LAIMNSAAINMGVQVSLLCAHLYSFRYMPKNDVVGSYGNSILTFLGKHCTGFHSGCTNLLLETSPSCVQEYTIASLKKVKLQSPLPEFQDSNSLHSSFLYSLSYSDPLAGRLTSMSQKNPFLISYLCCYFTL
jgi:hypothetical protein